MWCYSFTHKDLLLASDASLFLETALLLLANADHILSQCSVNFLLTPREMLFFTTQLFIILVVLGKVSVTV